MEITAQPFGVTIIRCDVIVSYDVTVCIRYLFFGDEIDSFVDLAESSSADFSRHLPSLLHDVS